MRLTARLVNYLPSVLHLPPPSLPQPHLPPPPRFLYRPTHSHGREKGVGRGWGGQGSHFWWPKEGLARLSVSVPLFDFFFGVSLYLYHSICLSLFVSMTVCLCLPVCLTLSVCLSVCLSVRLSLSVSTFLSLSLCLSLCVLVCLSVCLSVCLPVCLSVCLSLCLCLSLSLVQRN